MFLGENFDWSQLVASGANIEVLIFFWSEESIVRDFFLFRTEGCHNYPNKQITHEKSLNENNSDEVHETSRRRHSAWHLIDVSRTLSLSRDRLPRLSRHYLEHRTTSAQKVVKVLVRVHPLTTMILTIPHCFDCGLLNFGNVIHITTIK